jgi:hypothetical protein
MENIRKKKAYQKRSFKPILIKKNKDKYKKYIQFNNKKKNYSFLFSKSLILKLITIFIFFIIFFIVFRKFYYNKKKNDNKPKIKVAMCAIVKRENRYIKYFIDFYKKLGYDHIYLYDNNESGDEVLEDVPNIKEGVKDGFITIIDYKDKPGHPQLEAYFSFLASYSTQYDWISFFDIDEYLILEPKDISIQEFLYNPRFNNCDNIKINWRVFTDNEQLEYQEGSLMERFPIPTTYYYEERHVKSFVRGGLDYSKYKKSYNPHCLWTDIKTCTSSGKPSDGNYYHWPPDREFATLNHYVTKSVREFFEKKYKSKDGVDVEKIPMETKNYLFNYFFSVNKKTKEKVDIFNQIYHTNYQ